MSWHTVLGTPKAGSVGIDQLVNCSLPTLFVLSSTSIIFKTALLFGRNLVKSILYSLLVLRIAFCF